MTCKPSSKSHALFCDAAGITDVGCVRKSNEDAFSADTDNRLFIVADGVGGRSGGAVAAEAVIEMLPLILKKHLAKLGSESNDDLARDVLSKSLEEVGRLIYERGKNDVELAGMGSTALVARMTGNTLNIAHMGDSRAYLLRDGTLSQITGDHSVVHLLVAHGEISDSQAVDHPARGRLTRFAGMAGEVDPETHSIPLEDGDVICLCTDGLWGMVPNSRIQSLLSGGGDAVALCRKLINAGKDAGGYDNLTAVVLRIEPSQNGCSR